MLCLLGHIWLHYNRLVSANITLDLDEVMDDSTVLHLFKFITVANFVSWLTINLKSNFVAVAL